MLKNYDLWDENDQKTTYKMFENVKKQQKSKFIIGEYLKIEQWKNTWI